MEKSKTKSKKRASLRDLVIKEPKETSTAATKAAKENKPKDVKLAKGKSGKRAEKVKRAKGAKETKDTAVQPPPPVPDVPVASEDIAAEIPEEKEEGGDNVAGAKDTQPEENLPPADETPSNSEDAANLAGISVATTEVPIDADEPSGPATEGTPAKDEPTPAEESPQAELGIVAATQSVVHDTSPETEASPESADNIEVVESPVVVQTSLATEEMKLADEDTPKSPGSEPTALDEGSTLHEMKDAPSQEEVPIPQMRNSRIPTKSRRQRSQK